VAFSGVSRESSRPQGGKQEVASAQPCAGHAAAQCPSEEDKRGFAENPLGFERFQGKNKKCTLCKIW
jgi:hypothetical protein